MIRLKGPLQSHEASGSLADVLTFSKGKKTAYAKTYARPKDPQTPKQLAVRMMMSFLVEQWSLLTAPQNASWFNQALVRGMANYNAYVSTNQKRHHTMRTPSKVDPPTDGATAVAAPLINAIGWPGYAQVGIKAAAPVWDWGTMTARSQTSGFTPANTDIVRIFTTSPAGWNWWNDEPLDPGTYYYRHLGFNTDGQRGPWCAEKSVIVT